MGTSSSFRVCASRETAVCDLSIKCSMFMCIFSTMDTIDLVESVMVSILCVFSCDRSLMETTVLEISSMASFCSFIAFVICSDRDFTFSAFSSTVWFATVCWLICSEMTVIFSTIFSISLMMLLIRSTAAVTFWLPLAISCSLVRISTSMFFIEEAVWSASLEISSATTAKPRPASPARAASMGAFSERRFILSDMSLMICMMPVISWELLLILPMLSFMILSDCSPDLALTDIWSIMVSASSTSAFMVMMISESPFMVPSSCSRLVYCSSALFLTLSTPAVISSMEAVTSSVAAACSWLYSVKSDMVEESDSMESTRDIVLVLSTSRMKTFCSRFLSASLFAYASARSISLAMSKNLRNTAPMQNRIMTV